MRLLQAWQFDNSNLDNLINDAKRLNYDAITVKALDGCDFMNQFDASPDAIGNPTQVAEQCQRARDAGLMYYAWAVIRNSWIPEQTSLLSDVGVQADGLILDVEPYTHFWGVASPGVATAFIQMLVDKAPLKWLALEIDPRQNAIDALKLWEFAPFLNAIMTQSYWNDFNTNPGIECERCKQIEGAYQLPIIPVLPALASADDIATFAQFNAIAIWRWGLEIPTMSDNPTDNPTDTTPPTNEQVAAQLAALAMAVYNLTLAVGGTVTNTNKNYRDAKTWINAVNPDKFTF